MLGPTPDFVVRYESNGHRIRHHPDDTIIIYLIYTVSMQNSRREWGQIITGANCSARSMPTVTMRFGRLAEAEKSEVAFGEGTPAMCLQISLKRKG